MGSHQSSGPPVHQPASHVSHAASPSSHHPVGIAWVGASVGGWAVVWSVWFAGWLVGLWRACSVADRLLIRWLCLRLARPNVVWQACALVGRLALGCSVGYLASWLAAGPAGWPAETGGGHASMRGHQRAERYTARDLSRARVGGSAAARGRPGRRGRGQATSNYAVSVWRCPASPSKAQPASRPCNSHRPGLAARFLCE
jgi:hypothetical protein